jgi:hypothetical protein
MKTAMQELFSQLETEYPNLFNTHSVDGRNFINNYHKFLELEKQQIIDAVEWNYKSNMGEVYYKATFKTK